MERLLDLRCNADYAISLLRALLGAMIFALPLFMTMEMWELGVAMDRMRLVLLLLLSGPALVALSFYAGFEKTFSLIDNILDAFAAIAISTVASLIVLTVFGEIRPGMAASEIVGKLAVLSFAASIGALLADKQFNDNADEETRKERRRKHSFSSRLFVMGVGAIFLALNVAPTEEVQIIASAISPLQAILLAGVSVAALHIILTAVDNESGESVAARFVRRTLSGYGLCLLLCWYILWTFARLDGVGLAESVERVIVLAFPAALGAGAARLILGSKPDE
jgi:putative integral membrane protein (TIGR02587 family)